MCPLKLQVFCYIHQLKEARRLGNVPILTANIFAAAISQSKTGRLGNVPTLTANIFATATNRTNFHNKTGSTAH